MEDSVRTNYDAARDFSNKAFRSGCYAPFVSLFFNTLGDVLACCKNWTHVLGNVQKQSLKEIWQGEKLKVMREALVNYRFEAGCEFCEWEMKGGNYQGAFPVLFDEFPVQSMEPDWPSMIEFAGSNTCNFECVMCNGLLSSSIRARREGLPPLAKAYAGPFFDDLRDFLPHLKRAKFLGGEPFLAHECFRIWDMMIEDGLTTPCHVTTNGSQYNAKVERILEALPVSLSISIDGATKQTVEEIRAGCHYEQLIENIRRFRKYAKSQGNYMSLAYCLMRENWHEFGDLLLFAESIGCEVFVNTVVTPSRFSLYTLPPDDLSHIADKMEKQSSALTTQLRLNKKVWEEHVLNLRNNANERQVQALGGAKQAAVEGWRADPEGIWHNLTAAQDFVQRGLYDKGLEKLLQMPEVHPDYYRSVVLSSHIRRMQGDLEGAERDLERAVKISKRLPEAFISRAWLRLDQNHFDEGIQDALRARQSMHETDERQPYVCEVLGLLYERQGKTPQARVEIERLLELQPAPFCQWLLTRTTWPPLSSGGISDSSIAAASNRPLLRQQL